MAITAEGRKASQMRPRGAKKRLLSAGRSMLRKILPMAASIMISCSPAAQQQDECDRYNNSTVIINESESEGERIASVAELRESDVFISEELAFSVRATHDIATQGLPEEFVTAFTVSAGECFINPGTGLTGTAHAVTPAQDVPGDCGIYTILSRLTLDDFSLISHEIGHLQMPCGEVCAEVNAAEQMLMLFVAFSNQSDSEEDIIKWTAQSTNQIYGLEALYDALRHIYQDNFRLDPNPAVSMRLHPKWHYIRADILILESLTRHGGDFSAIRGELRHRLRENVQAEANESVERFIEMHSDTYLERELAGIFAEIRMAQYMELHRRFGADTANSYFRTNSLAAYRGIEPREIIRVEGLEGMDCMISGPAEITPGENCAGECVGFGIIETAEIEGAALHCFTVDGDAPVFSELDITASGVRYSAIRGREIRIGGVSYDAVVVFDEINAEQ